MGTLRLTRQEVERRIAFLKTAYNYTAEKQQTRRGQPSETNHMRIIGVIARIHEEQWNIEDVKRKYHAEYGVSISHMLTYQILRNLEKGGGIMCVHVKRKRGAEVSYTICNNDVAISCIDVYTKQNIGAIPPNEALNKLVKSILEEYGWEFTGAVLSINAKPLKVKSTKKKKA